MFNKTHTQNDIPVTFLKSTNVFVYPSGRRKSTMVEVDSQGKELTESEKYRFPFDPESRLNTEANNRKHSGLNGYTQTYLKDWDEARLSLALEGYLFNISLADDHVSANAFGSKVVESLAGTGATSIYANIILENTLLFSSARLGDHSTKILRNQSTVATENTPSESLDLLISTDSEPGDPNNYYFSGLSFSAAPLASINGNNDNIGKTRSQAFNIVKYYEDTVEAEQTLVSLRILDKVNTGEVDGEGNPIKVWKIHEPARLPFIEHGDTEDSIVITGDALLKSNLYVNDNINVGNPETPATSDNGGNIVAKNDITAERNLNAGGDLTVTGITTLNGETTVNNNVIITGTAEIEDETTIKDNTTITKNLVVGKTLDEDDSDITEGLIKTGTVKTDAIIINQALGAASAIIVADLAVGAETTTKDLTVNNSFTVSAKNADGTEKLDHSDEPIKVTIADGTITAKNIKDEDGNEITNIDASKAKFNNVHVQELTVAGTSLDGPSHGLYAFNMQHIIKKDTNMENNYNRPVPYIDVAEQADGTWQLQISRITKFNKNS